MLDILVVAPLPTVRTADKVPAKTKIDVEKFDENFPELWFRRLEVQFEAASIVKSGSRFAELLRFLEKRHSLAIAAVLDDANPEYRYEEAKKTLLSLFQKDKPTRIASILGEKLGDGENFADIRARISPRVDDLNVDDFVKFVLFREAPRNLATHLATKFDELSLTDFQRAADQLLADERRRNGSSSVGAVQVQAKSSSSRKNKKKTWNSGMEKSQKDPQARGE
ncbi:Hypothetical predicted protein, partial [Paramuricea clavata]